MKLSLAPDEVIGAHAMLRWHLIPPTARFAIYLHKHQASDPRTPHDHPADNISIRLRGLLFEYTPDVPMFWTGSLCMNPEKSRTVFFRHDGEPMESVRPVPRFCKRRAESPHRLELAPGKTAWTIWIRFQNRRPWGYFEPAGWRRRRLKSDPMAAEST